MPMVTWGNTFVYGMGAPKFRDYARDKYQTIYSEQEAVQARKAFFNTYSALPLWHERQRRLVHKFGYVRSLIGRKRNLPEIYSNHHGTMAEAERQSINSPVQGLGSDLNLFSLVRINRELDPQYIKPVGTVHDAILMMVKTEKLHEICPKVAEIMMDSKTVEKVFKTVPITIPLEVEMKAGPWGKGAARVIYDENHGVMLDVIKDIQKGD